MPRLRPLPPVFVVPFLALASLAVAQVDRYEIGLRLRAYERHVGACTDSARRAASLAELDGAVRAFFGLDLPGVARALDRADAALSETGPPTPAHAFARGLQARVDTRLDDPAAGAPAFEVNRVWPDGDPAPSGLRVDLFVGAVAVGAANLDDLPARGTLRLSELQPGDHELRWTIRRGDTLLLERTQGLSLAQDLDRRLTALTAVVDAAAPATTIEGATLPALLRTLRSMRHRRPEETMLPGAALLAEAEALAAAVARGEHYYDGSRKGQHWLEVPVGGRRIAVRFDAPAPSDGPHPIVVALHGLGGSENLFFDGYGDGAIVGACRARGFYLVAPRCSPVGTIEVPALVDALAARWPIDRERVLLVGHSMGAAQAIATAMRTPARFVAVAALGGGGSVPRNASIADRRYFVGVGERDFARDGALALHRQLTTAGASCTLHRYEHVEHLAIVQFALPDVFAFFDAALAH